MHWLDYTKQSPSSLDTPSQVHTPAVLIHTFLMVVLVQSLALVGKGVAVDLPGAVDKQVGGLQW